MRQAPISWGKMQRGATEECRGPAPLADRHRGGEEEGCVDESCSCIFYNLFWSHLLPDTHTHAYTHTHTHTCIHTHRQKKIQQVYLPEMCPYLTHIAPGGIWTNKVRAHTHTVIMRSQWNGSHYAAAPTRYQHLKQIFMVTGCDSSPMCTSTPVEVVRQLWNNLSAQQEPTAAHRPAVFSLNNNLYSCNLCTQCAAHNLPVMYAVWQEPLFYFRLWFNKGILLIHIWCTRNNLNSLCKWKKKHIWSLNYGDTRWKREILSQSLLTFNSLRLNVHILTLVVLD